MKEQDIREATDDLGTWLGPDLAGKSFLDVGCGSGLSSLAASRLGCNEIVSFDYDANSVAATLAIRAKEFSGNSGSWKVLQGSVLDEKVMAELPPFDIVYSWGVLHHTGQMWPALDAAAGKVKPGGSFYFALYNDQGWISKYWLAVKKAYVSSPAVLKFLMLCVYWGYFGVLFFVADLVRLRNPLTRHRTGRRGMKFFYDVIDWVGGLPFETAKPVDVQKFLEARGFSAVRETLVGRRHGCNEFLFRKAGLPSKLSR